MADTRSVVVGILARVPLFAELPPAEIDQLAEGARVRHYPPRQVVFTAGDPADALVVVLSGRVKVTVRSADGGELTLTTVPAGVAIGELGVVDGGPRSTDAVAMDETDLAFIGRDVIERLMDRHPSVTRVLLTTLAGSLRRLTDTTADLVFLDLPRRVAKLLLDQPPDDRGAVGMIMSQEELAHRVAGTRQSVNAAMRGFERRGWIEVAQRQVLLLQRSALERFVGDT